MISVNTGTGRLLRSLVPYQWKKRIKQTVYFGTRHRCIVCGSRTRRMLNSGVAAEVLERCEVIGAGFRPNDCCPVCRANDRIRLLLLVLQENRALWLPSTRVLHIAPERELDQRLGKILGARYHVIDCDIKRYSHLHNFCAARIESLPFRDCSFNIVICSHVLEHVAADREALRELHRVLTPSGIVYIQVPLALASPQTIEQSAPTPRDRLLLFGQEDHVRLYGRDFPRRIQEAQFQVRARIAEELPPGVVSWAKLDPKDRVFLCTKQSMPESAQ